MLDVIYCDYMATTPVDPRVIDTMHACLGKEGAFGNPTQAHAKGKEAKVCVEKARQQVADVIHAGSRDIVFTSGATESINLALQGLADFYQDNGKHIITSTVEHKATLEVCKQLEAKGFDVTYLPVKDNGLIDIALLKAAVREDTLLISVTHVNNEIGVIQDIQAIGEFARSQGIFFHVDAAQSIGKVAVDVKTMCIDLMSMCAHKAYGPKGVGALYARSKPRIHLTPLFYGGGHERGLRAGTLPTHQIVGLGEAFAIAETEREAETARIAGLHDRFYNAVKQVSGFHVNGDNRQRVPHNINIRFDDAPSQTVRDALPHIIMSSESACNAVGLAPSHVLTALGLSQEEAHQALRISFGRFTTEQEVDILAKALVTTLTSMRQVPA